MISEQFGKNLVYLTCNHWQPSSPVQTEHTSLCSLLLNMKMMNVPASDEHQCDPSISYGLLLLQTHSNSAAYSLSCVSACVCGHVWPCDAGTERSTGCISLGNEKHSQFSRGQHFHSRPTATNPSALLQDVTSETAACLWVWGQFVGAVNSVSMSHDTMWHFGLPFPSHPSLLSW